MEDPHLSISLNQYKKLVVPIRIGLSIIIAIQFFGIYDLPTQVLYPAAIFSILHLTSIAYEKAKLSTVEIAERKCKICGFPMYSKIIKCEKCNVQIDTDDEKNN